MWGMSLRCLTQNDAIAYKSTIRLCSCARIQNGTNFELFVQFRPIRLWQEQFSVVPEECCALNGCLSSQVVVHHSFMQKLVLSLCSNQKTNNLSLRFSLRFVVALLMIKVSIVLDTYRRKMQNQKLKKLTTVIQLWKNFVIISRISVAAKKIYCCFSQTSPAQLNLFYVDLRSLI